MYIVVALSSCANQWKDCERKSLKTLFELELLLCIQPERMSLLTISSNLAGSRGLKKIETKCNADAFNAEEALAWI